MGPVNYCDEMIITLEAISNLSREEVEKKGVAQYIVFLPWG
jgi:hypothetical protein